MTRAVRLIVVEGILEKAVARRLIDVSGLRDEAPEPIVLSSRFWSQAGKYNAAACHVEGLILGLKDLEKPGGAGAGCGVTCAPSLLARYLPSRHPGFLLRIAVVETEAWLLADAAGMARFLGVGQAKVPVHPDSLPDPKQVLVNLARASRKPSIQAAIVPRPAAKGVVGAGYTDAMTSFAAHHWDPETASQRSESLHRALEALRRADRGDFTTSGSR